jgi:hypothetical protein
LTTGGKFFGAPRDEVLPTATALSKAVEVSIADGKLRLLAENVQFFHLGKTPDHFHQATPGRGVRSHRTTSADLVLQIT